MRKLLFVSALLMLAGCFEPDYSQGKLRCAVSGKQCPDGHECAADNFCYRASALPDLHGGVTSDLGEVDQSQTNPDLIAAPDLLPSSVEVTVVLDGNGTGTVTSNPMGIDCPGTCSASFPVTTTVVLSAAPAGGSTRGPWTGCDAVTGGGSCTVSPSTNATIVASFIAGENCFDNMDNDGDGKVDCADEDCTTHVCREAPGGWNGPITLVAGAAETPSCPSPYLTTPQLRAGSGVDALAATCASCSCTTGTSSGSCDAAWGEVGLGDAATCAGPAGGLGAVSSQCIPFGDNVVSRGMTFRGPIVYNGVTTCEPPTGGMATLAPPSWSMNVAACAVEAPAIGGCSAGSVCVPNTAGGERACVYKAGDVACPGAPYNEKFVYHSAFTDTRDCAACQCEITPNTVFTCTGTITCDVYGASDTNCSGTKLGSTTLGPATETSACIPSLPLNFRAKCTGSSSLVSAACSPVKATPNSVGTVVEDASTTVTVCCI